MAINGQARVVLGLEHTGADEATEPYEKLPTINFDVTDGTTEDQMDLVYVDQRTLAASATEDLDLAGGVENSFGDTLTFVDVRMIFVKASSDNTNDVLVGGAASNAFVNWVSNSSDVVVVKPGGVLFLYTPTDPGYAVTASTGDLLRIGNSSSGTSVTYDIYVGGTSA